MHLGQFRGGTHAVTTSSQADTGNRELRRRRSKHWLSAAGIRRLQYGYSTDLFGKPELDVRPPNIGCTSGVRVNCTPRNPRLPSPHWSKDRGIDRKKMKYKWDSSAMKTVRSRFAACKLGFSVMVQAVSPTTVARVFIAAHLSHPVQAFHSSRLAT